MNWLTWWRTLLLMDIWNNPATLDKKSIERTDPAWVAARWEQAKQIIAVAPGGFIDPGEGCAESSAALPYDPQTCFYLGDEDSVPVFAHWSAGLSTSLRTVLDELTETQVQNYFAAVAVVNWHLAAQFCPVCGNLTRAILGGMGRECHYCPRELFPRTDPATITAITDSDDRLLLGRPATWEPNRFSLFAGFVEAGESGEQAVHRELYEETGLRVTDVRYYGSQPWPFPRSLMLGFTARAITTDFHALDHEIEKARWFTRNELVAAVASKNIILPMIHSIARRIINDWIAAKI